MLKKACVKKMPWFILGIFGSCKNATFTWIHSFFFLDSSEEEVKYNLKYIEYICEAEQNKYQTCAVEKLDQFIKENIQQN